MISRFNSAPQQHFEKINGISGVKLTRGCCFNRNVQAGIRCCGASMAAANCRCGHQKPGRVLLAIELTAKMEKKVGPSSGTQNYSLLDTEHAPQRRKRCR
jgi:hypothetical protein